ARPDRRHHRPPRRRPAGAPQRKERRRPARRLRRRRQPHPRRQVRLLPAPRLRGRDPARLIGNARPLAAVQVHTRMDIGSVLRETGETVAPFRPLVVMAWAIASAAAAGWVTCYPRHRKAVLSLLAITGAIGFVVIAINRQVTQYYK